MSTYKRWQENTERHFYVHITQRGDNLPEAKADVWPAKRADDYVFAPSDKPKEVLEWAQRRAATLHLPLYVRMDDTLQWSEDWGTLQD